MVGLLAPTGMAFSTLNGMDFMAKGGIAGPKESRGFWYAMEEQILEVGDFDEDWRVGCIILERNGGYRSGLGILILLGFSILCHNSCHQPIADLGICKLLAACVVHWGFWSLLDFHFMA